VRLASAAGPAVVPLLTASYGIEGVFLIFGGLALLGALPATQMIETRHRRLEDIAP
jgi:hypothetical protein